MRLERLSGDGALAAGDNRATEAPRQQEAEGDGGRGFGNGVRAAGNAVYTQAGRPGAVVDDLEVYGIQAGLEAAVDDECAVRAVAAPGVAGVNPVQEDRLVVVRRPTA